MMRDLFMYGSIEILGSFLFIPVNINLRRFFILIFYINVQCQLMSCIDMHVLEILTNARIP